MLIIITFLSSKYKHVFLFLNLYTNFPGFKNLGGAFVSATKEIQLAHAKHLVLGHAIFEHLATEWKLFTRVCCDDVIIKSSDRIFMEFKAEFWGAVRVYLI